MKSDILVVTYNTEPWNLAVTLDIIIEEVKKEKQITWFLLEDESLDNAFLPLSSRIRSYEIQVLLNRLGTSSIDFFKNVRIIDAINLISPTIKVNERAKEAARAELISRLRESNPCEVHNQKVLGKYSKKYLELNHFFYEYLAKNKFKTAYVFNGRPLCERAFTHAALDRRQKLEYFEIFNANWTDRYFIFGKPIHSARYRSRIMLDFSEDAKRKNQRKFKEDASIWFEQRIAGVTQPYTKNQRISDSLSIKKPFYVYFHSSQDELDMVGMADKYWGNQFNTLRILVSLFRSQSHYQLVLRVHPHLKHKSSKDQNNWNKIGKELQIKYPWFTYFGPNDPVSSYRLIQEAQGVITSGSTIGVEAAYLRKKSVLLGNAFHKPMGITINPKNKDQLHKLIFTSKLPRNSERSFCAALNYGYFHANGGRAFSFIEHRGKNSYYLNSVRISYSLYLKAIRKIELKISSLLKNRAKKCDCDNLINAGIRW